MTGPERGVVGPRELIIAAAICAVILLAFFGGYQLGKQMAERDNRAEATI